MNLDLVSSGYHCSQISKTNSMMISNQTHPSGLVLSNTEAIRSFLTSASIDVRLSEELRQIALDLSSQDNVTYRPLRAIWSALESSDRPDLLSLLSGSGFVLASPKPREKSEELKARLAKLADVAERKAYQELVKDIAPEKPVVEPFSSYKDQLGFGLHVALIMFTGYLLGYALFRALFRHDPVMSAAGGILGLVFGMLVETLLFIIRSSNYDQQSSSSRSKLKKSQ